MIRIARTFTAKPGMERELVDVLKNIRDYARDQGVESRVFTEPWGPGGVIRVHNDFDDAGRAQTFWQSLSTDPRARESRERIQLFIEGHRETSFLVKTT
ncbi:MAG: hypothetical protein IIC92_09460 [Chloroflexi bacterium]|nr:hypothetical protein [Chloroflexota bacterium]